MMKTKPSHPFVRPVGYGLLVCFLLCGFIGWVWETGLVLVYTRQFTMRGILFIGRPPMLYGLPVIPIYGFGGTVMCFAFSRWKHHPVRVFFVGLVGLTLFELLASYFCQYVLGKTYWDYSYYPFNFEGRIALFSALAWGGLSVLAVKLIGPLVRKLYYRLKGVWHWRALLWVLGIYTVVCMVLKY